MLKKTGNNVSVFNKALLSAILFLLQVHLFAQDISLTAQLDNSKVWLGDSVQLIITLKGSEQSFKPKLLLPNVEVESLGGSKRSSESVTNINGKVTRNVSLSYIFSFKLTPLKPGVITIPPIKIDVGGKSLQTRELTLEVTAPEYSDDYHLILTPNMVSAYISEEVELTVSFLFNSSIRELGINIPELEKFSYNQSGSSTGNEQYQININGEPFYFYRSDQTYRGKEYAGISTRLLIKSPTPGMKDLSKSTAIFDTVTGSERVRDFFGRVQEQAVYSKITVPSEPSVLKILPFPEEGKPEDFTGLSGTITAEISAEPEKVYIGDPITLKIKLSGLNNPQTDLPPLGKLLGDNFDIPDTRSFDNIKDDTKEIIQTIRVKSADTKEIPSLKLSYFDTKAEEYKQLTLPSIPLEVMETTILTSSDLESSGEEEKKNADKIIVEKTKDGIYYNYTGNRVLQLDTPLLSSLKKSSLIWLLIISPPFIYMIFISSTLLIPKLRYKIISNRDRKAEYKSLIRKLKKTKETPPKEFLRICNGEINKFIRKYSIDCTNSKVFSKLEILNSYIYGGNIKLPENVRSIIDDILKLLDQEGLI